MAPSALKASLSWKVTDSPSRWTRRASGLAAISSWTPLAMAIASRTASPSRKGKYPGSFTAPRTLTRSAPYSRTRTSTWGLTNCPASMRPTRISSLSSAVVFPTAMTSPR